MVVVSNKMHEYLCLIPIGFQNRDISLYGSKTVEKKDIQRIVGNKKK
jgi:hypothetical protein